MQQRRVWRPLVRGPFWAARSKCALMAELVDALLSGSSAERRGGSSPLLGTIASRLLFMQRMNILTPFALNRA